MEQSYALRRRHFLLQMLGSIGACTGLAAVAHAAPNGRDLIDRLVSPSRAARRVDKAGDGYRYFKGLGLPDHPTGAFPNPNCPGPILPQNQAYRLTAAPAAAASATPLGGWVLGVGVNGVVFDPTGPYYYHDPQTPTGWQFEVLASVARPALGIDANNAHTQPSGEYHYHGVPVGLITALARSRAQRGEPDGMLLLGWAADGFPIYAQSAPRDPWDPRSPLAALRSSYALRSGPRLGADSPGGSHDDHPGGVFVQDFEYRPGSGELDECNGRYGVTPEYPAGTYYYVVTNTFPFVPRAYRGVPDPSFWHPSPGYDAVPPALRTLSL